MMRAMDGLQAPFDRRRLRLHRARAAAGFAAHDFLFREVADRLGDRLGDLTRRFPLALDLGCHGGATAAAALASGKIDEIIACDVAPAMARRACARTGMPGIAADEEALPFAPASFDLVLSNLSLHWVNDLPGALLQIRQILKPDGFFLAALFGAGSLAELGEAMIAAESAVLGGARPRLAPLADLRDLAGLLQRAGFALPVADLETITATYADPIALLADLRGMGESNLTAEPHPLRRDLLTRMGEEYRRRFAAEDGRVPATFRIVFLAGWAPGEAQQKPLRPGSAKARLADALGTTERPAGEKAGGGHKA